MRKTRILWPMTVLLGVALTACGTVVDPNNQEVPSDDDSDESDTEGPNTSGPVSATSGDDNDDSNDDPSDDSADSADEDTGCTFLMCTDVDNPGNECDMFAQDCPSGEKCMPWADDGGVAWNATRCVPIDDSPVQPGDECQVEGSGVSGIDNCELGAMCWNVDSETNTGTCAPMCTGDEANPLCEDQNTTCVNVNEGAIVLCLPLCDPLLQDCSAGQACYAINDDYTCVPDASGEMGLFGDPCEYINACDPGLFCAVAGNVPNCVGAQGCCSEFCDLDAPEGNAQCSGEASGQECAALSSDPQPGFEAVGGCLIPM